MEQHGHLATYIHGCRCEPCRGSNREAQRKHRERRKSGTVGRKPAEKKPRPEPKTRKHTGAPIADGADGWEHIWYGEDVEWTLAIREGAEWQQVKLAANGAVEHKANYWLAWNGERMAKSTDFGLLEKNRPELSARVVRCLVNWSSFQRAMARHT